FAKQTAEHVAVDEARQVAEHRTGCHRRVWGHQFLKRRLRLLARLGHGHRAHGRNPRPYFASRIDISAVITGITDPPTSIRSGMCPSVEYASLTCMKLCC